MKLQFPFLQLPIQFDADALAREVHALGDDCWRKRMHGVAGNSALALVTTDGDPDSDELAGDMRPTPLLERCPAIMQVMDALGATWGRSRLMRINGRSHLAAHVDTNYYWQERMRVHVPIVTTPEVRFHCGDAEIHMAAGECWVFDTWRRHGVVNNGDVDRIHLVMDTVGGDGLWQLLAEGRPAGVTGVPEREWNPRFAGFDPSVPAPRLDFESRNVPLVMTPWEIREHVGFLLREAVPDPRLATIQRALSLFTRSWQASWACHGEDHVGWPRYRALLDRLRRELLALGAGQVGLRNEVGLMHALDGCLFAVALGDDAGLGEEARRDHHGGPANAAPDAPPVPASPAPMAAEIRFERPLFIVSPPRSGSTLLFETLAQAPGLYTIGDESHELIEGIAALSPAQRGYDSNRLREADASGPVAVELRQRFRDRLCDRGGKAAESAAAIRLLEKTPKNALRIPFLREVFPDARFIYLHRDPRQVLGSMLDGWQSGGFRMYPDLPGWSGPPWSFLLVPGWRELIGKPLEDIVAAQWQRTMQVMLDDLDALPADRWTGVDYARFLENPQREISRVCDWAGLGWDRTLDAQLPLSRYTLTAPDPDKWRRHAAAIEPRLAALEPLVARARAAAQT